MNWIWNKLLKRAERKIAEAKADGTYSAKHKRAEDLLRDLKTNP